MNHNMNRKSSKELMYSQLTGSTNAEHVLEALEKKSNKMPQIETFERKVKSECYERARRFLGLIEKEQDASNASAENLNEKSNDAKNTKDIKVIMEVDENSPESNLDAWVFIDLPEYQESKLSEDQAVKNSSGQETLSFVDSSDTSDDESEKKFPVISSKFELNDTILPTTSNHNPNLKHSSKINNALNFLNDDSSDASKDESEESFPVISNGFMLNDTDDSSNSSSVETENNLFDSFKLQSSSNFINDESSNSSDDMGNGFYPSISKNSILKENKRKFKIVNNKSSEYLNCESHYSSSNPKGLSSKKSMFIINDYSDCSLDECEYSSSLHDSQKYNFEQNFSDSSSNVGDDFISGKRKLYSALESESSKIVSNGTGDSKKKKLCVIEDEISSICDTENSKKICVLDRRV